MPSEDASGKFDLGLCCDRRGDDRLTLGKSLESTSQVDDLWGSEKHWDIHKQIRVNECPRCTYQPHNQIFEHVVLSDNMTYRFI
jgi:hypothetical protein